MTEWAGERVGLSSIPPSEPWRNRDAESFDFRVRDECLNINIFRSLPQTRIVIGEWTRDFSLQQRNSTLATERQRPILLPAPAHDRFSSSLVKFRVSAMCSCRSTTYDGFT